jgi:methionyl-tRNA formyltransferase
MAPSHRIALISQVTPVVEPMVGVLRELGHEPVAVISARRPAGRPESRSEPPFPPLSDSSVPAGLAIHVPSAKEQVAPILRIYEPDVTLCWGYPWKLPLDALQVARLGSVNQHPALLPRHRGPIPFAWALREGDSHFGITWHRMDAELDTGAILAQSKVEILDTDCTILDIAPRILETAFGLLPRVFERLDTGDPGDPQPEDGASWAGHFGEDYAEIDWTQPARSVHNQVRAWNFTFDLSDVVGPLAELDGERVRLIRTSLTDPGDGARRVECADGPIWVVEHEQL